MPPPPLSHLKPRLVSPDELQVRALGHAAFDAAEVLQGMKYLAITATDVMTPEEALQLLGVEGEDGSEVMALGWAVELLG
jgi:hypothetical protein